MPKLPAVALIPFDVIPPIKEDTRVVPKAIAAIPTAEVAKVPAAIVTVIVLLKPAAIAAGINTATATNKAALTCLDIYPPSLNNVYITFYDYAIIIYT